MNLKYDLLKWSESYEDTPYYNLGITCAFRQLCWHDELLRKHREFIENDATITAFGDRCVQYIFKLCVDEMPKDFKFLEIGIYKGQIISLVQALATRTNRDVQIIGVTPLRDPEFNNNEDRMPDIIRLFDSLNITRDNTDIIDGRSQTPSVVEKVKTFGKVDLMFIDGDHSYNGAFFDMNVYAAQLKSGGLLVIDDTNNFKNFPHLYDPIHKRETLFTGLEDVSRATRDALENNPQFEELLACMHVRIFQKV